MPTKSQSPAKSKPATKNSWPAKASPQPGPKAAAANNVRPRKAEPSPAVKISKTEQIIGMLRSGEGGTIDELVTATGWQAHSIRGAISGTLKKKLGLAVASQVVEGRGRVYRIGAST